MVQIVVLGITFLLFLGGVGLGVWGTVREARATSDGLPLILAGGLLVVAAGLFISTAAKFLGSSGAGVPS